MLAGMLMISSLDWQIVPIIFSELFCALDFDLLVVFIQVRIPLLS